ncbi:hypothetical protein BTW08_06795 [Salinicola sp. MH3R3-1]|uniref:response regulator transcription factor n=1 Tax=Salinicola sp. MH3R3-1 TaxID=1928762 RepID=UPI00094E644C|nr:response regulator transcription factor [Salinicola sp. MH3R3-1]OLO08438.1 hypothetical protein BTW08_06795 [Salinicola sp. MH3R3-1]
MNLLICTANQREGLRWRRELQAESIAIRLIALLSDASEGELTSQYDAILHIFGDNASQEIDRLSQFRLSQYIPVLAVVTQKNMGLACQILDAGADDFLPTPMDIREIHARLRCRVRRARLSGEEVILASGLRIDLGSQQAWWFGEKLCLSSRELRVLSEFAIRPGHLFTKDYLKMLIYGQRQIAESNTVEVLVHSLRKKTSSRLIETVRGVGYALARLDDRMRDPR